MASRSATRLSNREALTSRNAGSLWASRIGPARAKESYARFRTLLKCEAVNRPMIKAPSVIAINPLVKPISTGCHVSSANPTRTLKPPHNTFTIAEEGPPPRGRENGVVKGQWRHQTRRRRIDAGAVPAVVSAPPGRSRPS